MWIVMNSKPAINTVFSTRPLLVLERDTSQKRLRPFATQSLDIFGMKEPFTKVRFDHLVYRETGVVEHSLICVLSRSIWRQDHNRLRNRVHDLSQLAFRLFDFIEGIL